MICLDGDAPWLYDQQNRFEKPMQQNPDISPADTGMSRKSSISGILAFLCSAGLIALLFYEYRHQNVWGIISGAWSLMLLAGSAMVLASHILFTSERLRVILKGMGIHIPFADGVRVRMGCSPMKLLVPFKAGELLKAVYLWKKYQIPFPSGVSSLLFDKIMVIFTLLPTIVAAAIISGEWPLAGAALLLAFCSILAFIPAVRKLMLAIAGRMGDRIAGFADKLLSSFEIVPVKNALFVILYTALLLTAEIILFFICFHVVDFHAPAGMMFSAIIAAQIAGIMPFFISGIGGREATLVYFLGAGTGDAKVFAAGILFTIFGRVLIHLAGLIWLPSFMKGAIEAQDDTT